MVDEEEEEADDDEADDDDAAAVDAVVLSADVINGVLIDPFSSTPASIVIDAGDTDMLVSFVALPSAFDVDVANVASDVCSGINACA